MKQYGRVYHNFDEMQSFINNTELKYQNNILIQVFSGITEYEYINKIIYELTILLLQAEIIGATTDGEIF